MGSTERALVLTTAFGRHWQDIVERRSQLFAGYVPRPGDEDVRMMVRALNLGLRP